MKEEILKALRQGSRVSGEKLGADIGISRTAVWKYITELRTEGYQIDSSPSKGYALLSAPDNLTPQEIKEGLRTSVLGREIIYYTEVSSTQDVAKSMAIQRAGEGTIIIAERQTGGQGRLGRKWESLPGSIALSIILRPPIHPSEAPLFTIVAGVAVAQAIEKATHLSPQLKWPNDIIAGGKKVGGILAEMSAEMDRVNYIVLGIGINVNTPRSSLPADIKAIATSLKEEGGKEISRVKLVQSILEELETLYEVFRTAGFEPIRQRWTVLSNTIGARVTVTSGEGERTEGIATEMDRDGALILRKGDGTLERVIAGDVSLRNS
ncbi:MAG: biotin--[acetyl-CoA-carboxylase] ligase [Dehalococcoidia bacterium]|nr:biotin--[acetyl-CoA-carboxylase] ligase [Dehalococcoidia bacterium]